LRIFRKFAQISRKETGLFLTQKNERMAEGRPMQMKTQVIAREGLRSGL
jgi:hypothetical protein